MRCNYGTECGHGKATGVRAWVADCDSGAIVTIAGIAGELAVKLQGTRGKRGSGAAQKERAAVRKRTRYVKCARGASASQGYIKGLV